MTSLLRGLLNVVDPDDRKPPQRVVEADHLSWKPLSKRCIEVVDYTDCPSHQDLNAIENELKELVDSLDLDGCLDSDISAMPN
jgi:hypothetical protein